LAEISFHVRLLSCPIPAPGIYSFTLLVDREWIAQRRVRIYAKGD
jgi:hypothetical protein